MRRPASPGLDFEVLRAPIESSPLRTDVVAVIGRTERGPVGRPIRLTAWQAFVDIFGLGLHDAATPNAVRACFANGAEVVWVERVVGPHSRPAFVTWHPASAALAATCYRFEARGAGEWANGIGVDLRLRKAGRAGQAELDVRLHRPGGGEELHAALDPRGWVETLGQRSRLLHVVPGEPRPARRALGPRHRRWPVLRLSDGRSTLPDGDAYAAAAQRLEAIDEPAIYMVPDLWHDLGSGELGLSMIELLTRSCLARADRMLLSNVPATIDDPIDAVEWVADLRARLGPAQRRTLAVYHPDVWLPLPDGASQVTAGVATGHVAGLFSRLDRARGPHHTPADEPLGYAVDVRRPLMPDERWRLHAAQINPIVVDRGRGVVPHGGRTLDFEPEGRFIAHRRLIHRLVRAIRRATAPLVFEPAGPDVRLSLLRTITTILLETWRAGGLKGTRPDEGFRVRCDDLTTSAADADAGRLICEIDLAPAAPMEFICIRVSLGRDGTLEVAT